MTSKAKFLLEELRQQNRDPDWRRDKPFDLPKYERLFVNSGPDSLNKEDLTEAAAIYAKLRIKPVEALENFCALAVLSASKRSWAKIEVLKIVLSWHNVREILIGHPDIDSIYLRCKRALRNTLRHFPSDRIFNRCLALIMREHDGLLSALEQLERALLNNAPVADIYCHIVNKELLSAKNSTLLRLISHVSPFLREKLGHEWLCLNLNKACLFSTLMETEKVPEWVKLLDRRILLEQSGVECALKEIFDFLLDQSPKVRAQVLFRLSEIELFWVSSSANAEMLRLELINYIFDNLERDSSEENRRLMLLSLYSCAPRTVSFWSNPAWRNQISSKIFLLSRGLSEPARSKVGSRFLFALGNYDDAEVEFKIFAENSPESKGPSTFVNPNRVGERLLAPASRSRRVWPDIQFCEVQNNYLGDSPTIIISGNDRYLHLYGERYARKVSLINKEGHLHIHLFGDPSSISNLLPKVRKTLQNFRITLSWESVELCEPYYFATGRFLRLADWSKQFRNGIVMTDIDSLWGQKEAGPLTEFVSKKLSAADVGLNLRAEVIEDHIRDTFLRGNRYPSPDPWDAVRAAKLILSGSLLSQEFATMVSALASLELASARTKPAKTNWFIDQNILSAAYSYARRNNPSLKFADLSSD